MLVYVCIQGFFNFRMWENQLKKQAMSAAKSKQIQRKKNGANEWW